MIFLDSLITKSLFKLLPHTSFFDGFFLLVSAAGNFASMWLLLFLILLIFEELRHKKFIVLFVGGLLLTSFLVNMVLKNVFQRPRPFQVYKQIENTVPRYGRPENFSFPSGHAAISFFVARLLAYYHNKKRLVFYALASVVSYSRIYLGVHYFFDVVFGAIMGILIAKLLVFTTYGFCKEFEKGRGRKKKGQH